MRISPTGGSRPVMTAQTTNNTDSRARAVAAFNSASEPPKDSVAEAVSAAQSATIPPTPTAAEIQTQAEPGQIDTNEAPIEASPEPSAETTPASQDTRLSQKYAQLARREKQLRQKYIEQERAIKAKEEELKAKEEQLAKQYESWIPRDRIKQAPLDVLNEAEVSYDELVQRYIDNQNPVDPRVQSYIQKLEAKTKALEERLDTATKQAQEQQSASYQAALNQIHRDVKALVNEDPQFETIKATGTTKDVVKLIEETYKKDGYLMSVEDAAQEVENYLVDEYSKLASLKKIQSRLTPAQASAKAASSQPKQETQVAPAGQQKQPAKTLTNTVGTSRQLSARERAVLAFEGKLNT